MRTPLILLLLSLTATVATLALPGASDALLVAVPCLIASLILVLRHPRPKHFVIVDGSNVMHWKDGTPRIEALHHVIAYLTAHRLTPRVIFDANAGHKLVGRYLHGPAMAARLGLPQHCIIVVPKGTPADPVILAMARDLDARIVTNDRYRDWWDAHPEVREPGHLIRGGWRDGQFSLDLGSQ
jgi:Zc3h12a-like Ribonuclease NYN domain